MVSQREQAFWPELAVGPFVRHDVGTVGEVEVRLWAAASDADSDPVIAVRESAPSGLQELQALLGPHPYGTLDVAVLPCGRAWTASPTAGASGRSSFMGSSPCTHRRR